MPYRPTFPDIDVASLPRTYVSYDLETTGLGADARMIEIGAVRVVDGFEDEKFSTLVALPEGVHVEPGAFAVNHIPESALDGAPDEAEAYRAFAGFVEDLPLVGQNIVAFDNAFVERAAARLGVEPITRNGSHDTLLLYRALVGGPASLAAICAHYGVTNEGAHRALSDAVATSDCYLAILRDAASRTVGARDLEGPPVGHELDGELVCFTGNSYDFPKRDCEVIAIEHGARLNRNMTRRVTFLVDLAGRDSGKLRRARELGKPVIGGEAFLGLVGLSPEDLRRPGTAPRP